MTQLLVSVRDAEEASIASSCGVSIIDVKEPSRGSLGRADWETIREVVQTVGEAVHVSVALGELVEFDELTVTASRRLKGITFAKLGLANIGSEWKSRWTSAMQNLPSETRRVAVAYADYQQANAPTPNDVIEFAGSRNCGVVLIDTFDKSNGGLFDLCDKAEIESFINLIHGRGMKSAIAGSLTMQMMIDELLPMKPDVVAIRGAACLGDRTGRIDEAKLRAIASAVSAFPKEQRTKTV